MNGYPVDHDLETARTLRHWLERTAEALPDDPTGRERLLERVERTSQRSARWLPPVFPGGARITMHPATGLALVVAFVLVVAGLLFLSLVPRDDAALVAPGGETASPSADPTEETVLNASVTGSFVTTGASGVPDIGALPTPVSRWEDDVYSVRGEHLVRSAEWSDARLPSQMRLWVDRDEYSLEPLSSSRRASVTRGRVHMEDGQGSWSGQVESLRGPDEHDGTEWFMLTGDGGYRGLHAVLVTAHGAGGPDPASSHVIEGIIGEGDPTPAGSPPILDDQPDHAGSVAPTAPPSGPAVYTTATLVEVLHDTSAETSTWKGDTLEWRDFVTIYRYDWPDPRLPEQIRIYANDNEYVVAGRSPSERAGLVRGTAIGAGPGGTWRGSFVGLYPDTLSDMHSLMLLSGSGAYEGLYAVIRGFEWYDAEAIEHRYEVEALIVPGEPPPLPAVPAE